MNTRGDIEIRFLQEEFIWSFLTEYNSITVDGKSMQVGRRTPITQLNYSRYAVNFFVNGDSEKDILDAFKAFRKVLEITLKTHKNTAIKTGEHTVYL